LKGYFLFAFAFAGAAVFDFMVELLLVDMFVDLAGPLEFDVFVMLLGMLVVATGAGVLAGITLTGLLVLLALFEAASPQAIPKAPSPRTAESAIAFFICLQTPILSQRLIK
jgi:hypothetical protein